MKVLAINPQRIRDLREHAGHTQDEVAFRLRQRGHKANGRSIRRWESGTNTPHANIVPDLAAVLGVQIADLYEMSESGDDEDEETALRRLAQSAMDRQQDDLAVELLNRVSTLRAKKQGVA